MKFAIVVHGAPYSTQACHSALEFAKAVVNADHELVRVFFYHDAVHAASSLAVPPQDETDINLAWQQFGSANKLELVVCIASCLRRGILDETEANRYEKPAANIHPAFTVSGLGQLIDAALTADRVVTFGN